MKRSIAMKPRSAHFVTVPRSIAPWLAAFCLACCWAVSQAQTVRHSDVERELRQARYEQVFTMTQRALADRPGDPQMRFWHALALDKLGQTALAQSEYLALTQDHPELPEPHNNLGVLLLRQGELDAAQAAFQQAVRMNASYVQALENLADVLLLQARRLYVKASELTQERTLLNQKINALPPIPTVPKSSP
jgi:Flp pilus assembly protein TadD